MRTPIINPAPSLPSPRDANLARAGVDRWTGVVALAIGLATFAVFSRSLHLGLVELDDTVYVTDNLPVRGGLTGNGVLWAWSTFYAGNWHPLTWMSLMLDQTLFGSEPWGFHLTNVLLHSANSTLCFLALRRLTGDGLRAALATVLFAWHPLRVESVAWVAERKDVLSGLFWFLAVWGYAVWAKTGSSWAWRGAFAAFGAGLCAKQMLVTLPCVMLLLNHWPLARWSGRFHRGEGGRTSLWPLIREKWAFFLLALAASLAIVVAQRAGGALADLSGLTPVDRVRNALTAYPMYLYLSVWPVNLSVFYPFEYANYGWGGAALSAGFLLAITGLLIRGSARTSGMLVGWLWFLGTLVPVIGLVQVGQQSLACRYTYIPGVGLAILVAWSFPTPSSSIRRTALAGAAVATASVLAALTVWQIGYWRDTHTLMARALAITGSSPFVHQVLGEACYREGGNHTAREQFRRVVDLAPRHPNTAKVWCRLAHLAHIAGDDREEEACYRRALELAPHLAVAYQGLGSMITGRVLSGRGEPRDLLEARSLLEHAVRLEPDLFSTRFSLGLLHLLQGRLDDAEPQLRAAVRIEPRHEEARRLLEDLLARKQHN